MPRDASGNYSLPTGNPVVSGTLITADWANDTMPDLGAEITDSLSRSGEGGMLAPLLNVDGAAALPSTSWTSEPSSGLYRNAVNDLRFSVATQDMMRWTPTDVEVWNGSSFISLVNPEGIFDGPDPTLANSDAAIISGTDDPDANPHIAMGPTLIQAKSNATTGATLNINSLGAVNLGPQSAITGSVTLYRNGFISANTATDGWDIRSQLSAANAVKRLNLLDQDGTSRGYFGNGGTSNEQLGFYNSNDGAGIQITANDDSSVAQTVFEIETVNNTFTLGSSEDDFNIERDALQIRLGDIAATAGISIREGSDDVRLFTGGTSLLQVNASGVRVSCDPGFNLKLTDGGTTKGTIDLDSDDVVVSCLDTATDIILRNNSDILAQTATPANGGLQVNNQTTGSGLERVATTSDIFMSVLQEADETRTSTTTLTDGTYLDDAISLEANTTYSLEMCIKIDQNGGTNGGAKYDIGFPFGASGSVQRTYVNQSNAVVPTETSTFGAFLDTITNANLAVSNATIRLIGYVKTAGTAGTISFQWAQANASGNASTLREGGWIRVQKIG